LRTLIASLTVAAALVLGGAARPAGLPLKFVANVTLPGPSNRFDYTSLDPTANTLYIAHMDAGRLLAFDVAKRRVSRTIDAPGVHGVIAVPQLHRVYASATDVREMLTIDSRTGRVLARAPAGAYPDGLAFDSADHRIFVSDETGGVEAVFSASGRRIATVPLGGEAGNVQYDAVSGRILVAVQGRNELAVIDPKTMRVIRRVALAGCDHSHGLLVDAPHRLAFVACDRNARLLTLDLRQMRVTGSATVGGSPDVLAFDAPLGRLYVASEVGDVAVFRETGRRLVKLGQSLLAPFAHTVAVDPRTHLVYFPLQQGSRGRPQLRIMATRGP
jgi:DNA-binding beta-propeller fold protein YncE